MRIIICIAFMTVLWLGGSYVMNVLISYQEFTFKTTYLVVPVTLGVVEALLWKPKE